MNYALSTRPDSRYRKTMPGKLAVQLGWFSIALGAAELFASRPMARTLGMRGQENLIRAYGVREIVKGVGILTSSNPTPWLWGRVAGDALDLATLGNAYRTGRKQRNVAIAMVNVAAVTALDVLAAQQLGAISHRQEMPTRDYSDRSGFPRGVEASRGLAPSDEVPEEYKTPKALQPL
jgi:hypothetical protein